MAQVSINFREREDRAGKERDGSGDMDEGPEPPSNKHLRYKVSSLGDTETTETISCIVMHAPGMLMMVKLTIFWKCSHGSTTGILMMQMTHKEGRSIAVTFIIGISSS